MFQFSNYIFSSSLSKCVSSVCVCFFFFLFFSFFSYAPNGGPVNYHSAGKLKQLCWVWSSKTLHRASQKTYKHTCVCIYVHNEWLLSVTCDHITDLSEIYNYKCQLSKFPQLKSFYLCTSFLCTLSTLPLIICYFVWFGAFPASLPFLLCGFVQEISSFLQIDS